MKKIWITICFLALATPIAEIITEGLKNTEALYVTYIVAGIGILGIILVNKILPKTDNQYSYSKW